MPRPSSRPLLALARTAVLSVLLTAVVAACSGLADWNPGGIAWLDYEDGLAQAQREQKPILLVMYTQWCPYCKRLGQAFISEEVEREAQSYVMVRVDADARPDLNERFAPDGAYVPRVFLLAPDGTPDFEFVLSSGRFRYSIDVASDEHLLWTLRTARERHPRAP